MIPNKLHFVFGLTENFGLKPWKLCHYLAVKSAIDLNNPEKCYLYYKYKPSGEWFEKIEHKLELVKIEPPLSIFNRPLMHIAHQSDIIRLQALIEEGGIYMDVDTISVKPFTDLLRNKCVLGIQGYEDGTIDGLCNGVILAEKNSEFLREWLMSYHSHRSTGRDKYWAEHSVYVPAILAKKYPHLIHIEPNTSFHYPLYHSEEPLSSECGIKLMFENDIEFNNAYCHHLWETTTWEPYLRDLTVEDIISKDTTYNRIARRFL
jgi:hypothetical protein